jgi:hypothetical protein
LFMPIWIFLSGMHQTYFLDLLAYQVGDSIVRESNGTMHFKKMLNHCLIANIYSYLETSGGQSSNLYLNVLHFSTLVLIRHLWQLKTVVFLPWCPIHTVLLSG